MSLALTAGATRRSAAKLYERNIYVYRRTWLVIFTGMFEPFLYLGSVGLGFGHLIGTVHVDGRDVRYLDFVAPALLATSAMNGAIYDSTMNVFFKLTYGKVYDTVLATPLRPIDIAIGELAWSISRGALYALAFLGIASGLGVIHSWWALAALPAALLVGLCFGGLGLAATCFMRTWQDLDFVTLATLPLFLFSATFYPLSAYTPVVREVVRATPLYNGVALLRALLDGGVSWATLGHVGYLAALGVAGLMVASRQLGRRLLK